MLSGGRIGRSHGLSSLFCMIDHSHRRLRPRVHSGSDASPLNTPADSVIRSVLRSRGSEDAAQTNSFDALPQTRAITSPYWRASAPCLVVSPGFPRRRAVRRRRGSVIHFFPGFPDGVLGGAYCVLNLPCSLLRGSFGLSLGVAGHLADSLFDPALYLVRDAGDAISVHNNFPRLRR